MNHTRPAIWITIALTLLLTVLLLICYANSFNTQWQYDDFANIVHNEGVHLTQWSWPQLKAAFNGGWDYQVISRPLAYLSFAVNHYVGALDPFGYHLVNFVIHWLSAVVLFLVVQEVLFLPVWKRRYEAHARIIAFIAAALWACHPVQVTAVTYIVQRMTAMAGLFYISAIYCYVKARTGSKTGVRIARYIGCALFAVCAMMSKENTIMLVYALLLVELLFFQQINRRSVRTAIVWALGLSVLLFAVGWLYTDPFKLFNPYTNRSFTMLERVMTQPRILFIYLSVIAIPMTSRLSILHDIEASHSLIDPWTTLPAIAGVVLSIFFLIMLIPRHRLFAFCGLFFFLNHAVESSILNLELIYEHRNYIPSMFLFVPVAVGVVRAYHFFYYRRSFQAAIATVLLIKLVSQAYTTINYNHCFRNELSLWAHAVNLYPQLSLAHNNLGKAYWNYGLYEKSYHEIQKGVIADRFNSPQQKATAYYNLGVYEAYKIRDIEKALASFKTSLQIDNADPKVWHEVARMHMLMGDYEAAQGVLGNAELRRPENPDTLALCGIVAIRQHSYEDGVRYAQQALKKDPDNDMALMVMAQAHRYLGDKKAAADYWAKLLSKDTIKAVAHLALAGLYDELQQKSTALTHWQAFERSMTVRAVAEAVEFSTQNRRILPYEISKDRRSYKESELVLVFKFSLK